MSSNAFVRSFLFYILLVTLPARAEATTISMEIDDYVLFGIESMRLEGGTVDGGDLGVNDGSLVSSRRLKARECKVVANHVKLSKQSECDELFANPPLVPVADCGPARGFAGVIFQDVSDACNFPSPFPACDPGNDVFAAPDEHRSLGADAYGDVEVSGGRGKPGTLRLEGGEYRLCNLRAKRGAQILFETPTVLHVSGNLLLGNDVFLGPAPNANLDPSDIRVFVQGRRVRIGRRNDVTADLCAPDATLSAQVGAELTGGFVAHDIHTRRITAHGRTRMPASNTPKTAEPPAALRPRAAGRAQRRSGERDAGGRRRSSRSHSISSTPISSRSSRCRSNGSGSVSSFLPFIIASSRASDVPGGGTGGTAGATCRTCPGSAFLTDAPSAVTAATRRLPRWHGSRFGARASKGGTSTHV